MNKESRLQYMRIILLASLPIVFLLNADAYVAFQNLRGFFFCMPARAGVILLYSWVEVICWILVTVLLAAASLGHLSGKRRVLWASIVPRATLCVAVVLIGVLTTKAQATRDMRFSLLHTIWGVLFLRYAALYFGNLQETQSNDA